MAISAGHSSRALTEWVFFSRQYHSTYQTDTFRRYSMDSAHMQLEQYDVQEVENCKFTDFFRVRMGQATSFDYNSVSFRYISIRF